MNCSTCNQSRCSTVYPLLHCEFVRKYVQPTDYCVRWVKK